ncbi:S-layer homology domain-containing protein [Paenibacillus sp. NPDC058174]|uniref:S-layer homology domain-containing protein n=1 Tax=Paenibacillus sp. NPDC058174 TaxID=3346366 RepID=UPI0036DADD27
MYDGRYVWLVPSTANQVIRLDPVTGDMTGYDGWPSGFNKTGYAFGGSLYDGQNVWMFPYSSNQIVKLDPQTGEMTGYDNWPSGFDKSRNFLSSGAFDGHHIWLKGQNDSNLIKLDPDTGDMMTYNNWPAGFNGNGNFSVDYIDSELWLIPKTANRVIRVSSLPVLKSAAGGDKSAVLTWEPVAGAVNYKIYQSLTPGGGGSEAAVVSGSSVSHTVTGLDNGVTYYFTVKAEYSSHLSGSSNEASVTPLSGNADLSSLILSGAALNPAFEAGTTSYTAAVGSDIGQVTVTPVTTDDGATVKVNGTAVQSGSASEQLLLNTGANTITVEVKAADGSLKAYTVTLTRAAPPVSGGGAGTAPVKLYIDLNGKAVDPSTFDLTKSSVTLEAEPVKGSVYASLPAAVLKELASRNSSFIIEIKAPYGSYRIPVNLASMISNLNEVRTANGLAMEDMGFKISLTDSSAKLELDSKPASGLPGGKALGAAVDFRIAIVNAKTGAVIGAADSLSEPLSKILALSEDMLNLPKHWGAFRYNEKAGKFEFVSATKLQLGSGAWAVLVKDDVNASGVYLAAGNEVTFTDISRHWAEAYIGTAAAKGLVNGIGSGLYAPNRGVTAAEFTIMLNRAFGDTEAVNSGLPAGRVLTREEMAGMLAAAIAPLQTAEAGEDDTRSHQFTDSGAIDQKYAQAVQRLADLNIMTGTGGDLYRPKEQTTRAQAVTVIIRALVQLGRIDELT